MGGGHPLGGWPSPVPYPDNAHSRDPSVLEVEEKRLGGANTSTAEVNIGSSTLSANSCIVAVSGRCSRGAPPGTQFRAEAMLQEHRRLANSAIAHAVMAAPPAGGGPLPGPFLSSRSGPFGDLGGGSWSVDSSSAFGSFPKYSANLRWRSSSSSAARAARSSRWRRPATPPRCPCLLFLWGLFLPPVEEGAFAEDLASSGSSRSISASGLGR